MSEHQRSPHTPIAEAMIAHVTGGRTSDEPLWDAHYDPGFESVEQDGTTHTGREHVLEKHTWWYDNHTVHGVACGGVYYGQHGFGIIWEIDCEAKDGSFPRMTAKELALYTVRDGKVVREEFWAAPMG